MESEMDRGSIDRLFRVSGFDIMADSHMTMSGMPTSELCRSYLIVGFCFGQIINLVGEKIFR